MWSAAHAQHLRASFPAGILICKVAAEHIVISQTGAGAIKSEEHKQKCLHSGDLIHKILCGHLPPLCPILPSVYVCVCVA